jgi:hypothetical protein
MGSGASAVTVEEYEVDTGLLKALLDHEDRADDERDCHRDDELVEQVA